MVSSAYSISLGNRLFHHDLKTWFVQDYTQPKMSKEELEVTALVRSGDYFAMLATELDNISKDLARKDIDGYERLEKLIRNLLYLQHTYQITKK